MMSMEQAIQNRLDLTNGMIRLDDLNEEEKGRLYDAVDEMGIYQGVHAWLMED